MARWEHYQETCETVSYDGVVKFMGHRARKAMPSKIVWLLEAAKDVARLREFIQTKNPVSAKRTAERIKESAKILANNPESGKPVEELPTFRDI